MARTREPRARGEYPGARAPLGSGKRFAGLAREIAGRGKVRDPGAVAATIGRRKYGKRAFQAMAARGRKRAARRS